MTRSGSLVAVMLAIALAPLPANSQATLGGEWRGDVERLAKSLVDAQLVPGMSIAVTQGDRVVYSQGFGVADAASGRRIDEVTAFYIAGRNVRTGQRMIAIITRPLIVNT